MHRLLARQLRKHLGSEAPEREELSALIAAIDDAYTQMDADRAMLERSMELSSHELMERNLELAAAEKRYRTIFENATEGIAQTTAAGRFITLNPTLAEMCGYDCPDSVLEEVSHIGRELYVDEGRWDAIVEMVKRDGVVSHVESELRKRDGSVIWISETTRGVMGPDGEVDHFESTILDVTERKSAEAEREALQSRLMEASRQSGMAEVASNVIHNIGNVMNSVNVSLAVVTKEVSAMRADAMSKVVERLRETALNPGNSGADPAAVSEYLVAVTDQLRAQRDSIVREIACLREHLDHIGRIVTMQQGYGKASGVSEFIDLRELVEDALRLQKSALENRSVEVERQIATLPPMSTVKHHVLEILVNLIGNARDSILESGEPGRIVIRAHRVGTHHVCILVEDSGVGIAPDDLARIFSHGFTTKPNGHGFGLHGSALAAAAIGGNLTVRSGGRGSGATFSLELPLLPRSSAARLGGLE